MLTNFRQRLVGWLVGWTKRNIAGTKQPGHKPKSLDGYVGKPMLEDTKSFQPPTTSPAARETDAVMRAMVRFPDTTESCSAWVVPAVQKHPRSPSSEKERPIPSRSSPFRYRQGSLYQPDLATNSTGDFTRGSYSTSQ